MIAIEIDYLGQIWQRHPRRIIGRVADIAPSADLYGIFVPLSDIEGQTSGCPEVRAAIENLSTLGDSVFFEGTDASADVYAAARDLADATEKVAKIVQERPVGAVQPDLVATVKAASDAAGRMRKVL